MDRNTVVLLARYNKAVNEKMDAVIKTLTPEEWDKSLGGFFPSVRRLCSHLYLCDYNWLKRFARFRDFAVFNNDFFNREPYSIKDVLFEDMREYLAGRPLLDEKILAFAEELSDADVNGILKYSDTRGTVYEKNFGGTIIQSLNHDTHHRGAVSVFLEMLGRANDYASFSAVLQ